MPTNRVMIERRNVVRPDYVVLLAAFRTGDPLPKTTWNSDRTVLSIDLGDGVVDTIAFDRSHNDHRTRLTFERSGKTAP